MTEDQGVGGAAPPPPPESLQAGEGSPPEWPAGEQAPAEHGRHRLRGRYAQLRATADRTEQQVAAKAEDLRGRRASVRTAFLAYEHDRRHGGALLAGGLAYRFFIWLLPAALFLASLLSIVGDISSRSPADVADNVGLGASLAVLVAKAAKETGKGSWVLIFLGLFLMLWAGMSVWKALRLVSSVAWQVRPTSTQRLVRASIVVSAVGIGLLLSPILLNPLRSGPFIADVFASILIAAGMGAICLWLMLSLPHPDGIRWTAFVPGAILFGISVEVLRVVTSVYFVWRIGHSDLYGAFSFAAIFMAWLYLIGRIVVGALALTATRWLERHSVPPVT
ncbi:MAG TPA: YhjD/YihY/BrkB family envelope integrity protein [Actinomycetota bacterium]